MLDTDGGEVMRRRIATPHRDYEGALRTLADHILESEKEAGTRCSVGLGMPGLIDPRSGVVANAYNTPYNNRALKPDLEKILGREVRFANDANCFALSEAVDGAAKGARRVFGVIVGTGTGGGVVLDGHVWTGRNAFAGEWGHNPLPWPLPEELPGPDCYCGLKGCVETWLSGPGLAADHIRVTADPLTSPEIGRRAADGDPASSASLDRYEDRLARGLASIINVIDPEVIVLAGGLSNVQRLYANVPARWDRYVFSDTVRTKLRPPVHGDSTGVRGAAWLGRALAARSARAMSE